MRPIALCLILCGLLAAPVAAQCSNGTCPLVRKPAAKARVVYVPRSAPRGVKR